MSNGKTNGMTNAVLTLLQFGKFVYYSCAVDWHM